MSKKQNKKTEKNEEIHQIAKDFINQFKAVQIYKFEDYQKHMKGLSSSYKKMDKYYEEREKYLSSNQYEKFIEEHVKAKEENSFLVEKSTAAFFSEYSHLVYLHSTFDKNLMLLLKTAYNFNPKIREKYKKEIQKSLNKKLKKNTDASVKKAEEIQSMLFKTSGKKQDKIYLSYMDDFFRDSYSIVGKLNQFCEIDHKKNTANYNSSYQHYEESKFRRNLLVHRGHNFDQQYFDEIKKLHLIKEDLKEAQKIEKKLKFVSCSPAYFNRISCFMIILYSKFFSCLFDNEDLFEIVSRSLVYTMHECLKIKDYYTINNVKFFHPLDTVMEIYRNYDGNNKDKFKNSLEVVANYALARKGIVDFAKKSKENKRISVVLENQFSELLDKKKETFKQSDLGICALEILKGNNNKALDMLVDSSAFKLSPSDLKDWSIFENLRELPRWRDVCKKNNLFQIQQIKKHKNIIKS